MVRIWKRKSSNKTIIVAILFACCSMALMSCMNDSVTPDEIPLCVGEENVLEFSESVASISIDDSTLTSTGTSFTLLNTSSEVFWINTQEFRIQALVDGTWHDVRGRQYNITLIATEIRPGWPFILSVDWSDLYGELPAGVYRLVEAVYLPSEGLDVFVNGEFTLNGC